MDLNPAGGYSRSWLKIAFIWFCVGLLDASRTVLLMRAEGMHHAWTRLFFTLLLSWLPWALATPFIMYLARRHPQVGFRPSSAWVIHVAACAAIGFIYSAWTASFELVLNPWAVNPAPRSFLHLAVSYFNSGMIVFVILYVAILAVSYMLNSSRRLALHQIETALLNEQLSKAQLNALQRQIEPHFLFNALNAVAGLVREMRNDAAVQMIAGLSDLLREVMQDSSKQHVSLAEEMEFARKYLQIQKVRFADRLQLSVDLPEELFPAQVPRLVLQPILENAFKHGISKRAEGGAIRIAASNSGNMLRLSVYNDGPKLPDIPQGARQGIGIANLRTRLKSLYGASFDLSLINQGPCGVEVTISMPFQPATTS